MKRPDARRGRHAVPFWVVSAALHALVLGLLLLFPPVRRIVFTRPPPRETQVITRGRELERIVEDIRDRTAEKLQARVALLAAGQERMARNFEVLNAHHQPFADGQRSGAADRLEHWAADVLTRQGDLASRLSAAADRGDVSAATTAAATHQAPLLRGQEEVARGLAFLAADDAALRSRQEEAATRQAEVFQFLRWAEDNAGSARNGRDELARLDRLSAGTSAALAAAGSAEESANAAAAGAREALRVAEEAHQQARRADPASREAAQRRLDAAREADRAARQSASDARRRRESIRRDLDGARRDHARISAEVPPREARALELLGIARNIQLAATGLQASVINDFRARADAPSGS